MFVQSPWVESVVRVSFPPQGVRVELQYREPVAQINIPGDKRYLLDRSATILPRSDVDWDRLKQLGPLVLIHGSDLVAPSDPQPGATWKPKAGIADIASKEIGGSDRPPSWRVSGQEDASVPVRPCSPALEIREINPTDPDGRGLFMWNGEDTWILWGEAPGEETARESRCRGEMGLTPRLERANREPSSPDDGRLLGVLQSRTSSVSDREVESVVTAKSRDEHPHSPTSARDIIRGCCPIVSRGTLSPSGCGPTSWCRRIVPSGQRKASCRGSPSHMASRLGPSWLNRVQQLAGPTHAGRLGRYAVLVDRINALEPAIEAQHRRRAEGAGTCPAIEGPPGRFAQQPAASRPSPWSARPPSAPSASASSTCSSSAGSPSTTAASPSWRPAKARRWWRPCRRSSTPCRAKGCTSSRSTTTWPAATPSGWGRSTRCSA